MDEQTVTTEQATPVEETSTFMGSEAGGDNLDWKSSLPEDIRNEPTLQNFKDIESLAKTVIHQQKQMGSRIPMPKDENEWGELYNKLGRPEAADKYEYQVNDEVKQYFDDDALNRFKEVAHANGLNNKQVQALIDYQAGELSETLKNEPSQLSAQKIETEDYLKKEWGAEYDRNVRAAQRALQVYGDDEIMELMNTSAGNHPAVIRMFAKLGKEVTEDMAQNTANNRLAVSPLDAKMEIESVFNNQSHPYFNAQHPEHKAAVERVRELHEKVYGN